MNRSLSPPLGAVIDSIVNRENTSPNLGTAIGSIMAHRNMSPSLGTVTGSAKDRRNVNPSPDTTITTITNRHLCLTLDLSTVTGNITNRAPIPNFQRKSRRKI